MTRTQTLHAKRIATLESRTAEFHATAAVAGRRARDLRAVVKALTVLTAADDPVLGPWLLHQQARDAMLAARATMRLDALEAWVNGERARHRHIHALLRESQR